MRTVKTNLKRSKMLGIDGTLKSKYANRIGIVESIAKGTNYKPYSWSKSRGRYKLIGENVADEVKDLILACNVEYFIGNDSARNGRVNDFIYINTCDRAKLKRNLKTVKSYINNNGN